MTLVVAFDTNLYRSLSDVRFESLLRTEQSRGVRKLASFLAASELLGRVKPGAFDPKTRAPVRRLWNHCRREDDSGEFIMLSPDPHGVVAYAVFWAQHPERHHTANYFGAVVRRIATASASDSLEDIAIPLSRITDHRDDVESRFVGNLNSIRRLLGLVPNDPSPFPPDQRPSVDEFLRRGMARETSCAAIILNAANEFGIECTEEESLHLGKLYAGHISVTLRVYEGLIEKVLKSGANPSNFANDIWDAYLGLFASDWARSEGEPVVLVTEDQNLIRVAREELLSDRVLSLADYESLLGAG